MLSRLVNLLCSRLFCSFVNIVNVDSKLLIPLIAEDLTTHKWLAVRSTQMIFAVQFTKGRI